MFNWDGAYKIILDSPAESLIGAALSILVLSLAASILLKMTRRKFGEQPPLTLSLVLGVCLIGSIGGIGFGVKGRSEADVAPHSCTLQTPGGFERTSFANSQLFGLLDLDHDGRLSPREAAEAAERLVCRADSDGGGSVDLGMFIEAINRQCPSISPDAGPVSREDLASP